MDQNGFYSVGNCSAYLSRIRIVHALWGNPTGKGRYFPYYTTNIVSIY